MKRLVRAALAGGILTFTWYTLSQVAAGAPAAPLLVAIALPLLLLVLRAVTVASRRHDAAGGEQ